MPDILSTRIPAFLQKKRFNPDSNFDTSAIIYSGAKFRVDMTLIMEEDTFIGTNATILVPRLTMKKGSQINACAILTGKDEVILEENVVVGYGCILLTSSDTPEGKFMNDASPEKDRAIKRGPIELRRNCFIGSLTLIMPNVTIGENTVVGAQSFVNHDLPDYWLYRPTRQTISRHRPRVVDK